MSSSPVKTRLPLLARAALLVLTPFVAPLGSACSALTPDTCPLHPVEAVSILEEEETTTITRSPLRVLVAEGRRSRVYLRFDAAALRALDLRPREATLFMHLELGPESEEPGTITLHACGELLDRETGSCQANMDSDLAQFTGGAEPGGSEWIHRLDVTEQVRSWLEPDALHTGWLLRLEVDEEASAPQHEVLISSAAVEDPAYRLRLDLEAD
jgi:hypothetical protein